MKDAWVLRLKDEFNDSDVPQYYQDEDDELTDDINQANIIYDKAKAESFMKNWEEAIFKKFGEDAICNVGYTNMMKHFEWVEVEK
ncbi:hypothetical protein [Lysinibacillus piscis]|uniref:Uncharacterized protein n=1 Tax=Lysinibacillus piscis TaxID=2518931 RepID=A0ABQ5NK51_9BACI|nr:hypothetical protein [Lysinibacillus sp. KH24]GLC88682.1 hypothetical protein LYSBPC_18090 [Lysinibacillus sp. KH24]